MNKEEILAMEGEELDKLIAVEVMAEPVPKFIPEDALELQLSGNPVKSPRECWLCLCEYDQGDVPIWRPLPFSTDISAAWQVMEKLKVGDNETWFSFCEQVEELCGSDERVLYELNPEIICKAALLAKLKGCNSG
uniref:Phage ABA sandwich domain-containing protein n=1 Tax=viral metagenome TaxID=1070528 RepID=A0A6M3LZQ5_9ZZZZ